MLCSALAPLKITCFSTALVSLGCWVLSSLLLDYALINLLLLDAFLPSYAFLPFLLPNPPLIVMPYHVSNSELELVVSFFRYCSLLLHRTSVVGYLPLKVVHKYWPFCIFYVERILPTKSVPPCYVLFLHMINLYCLAFSSTLCVLFLWCKELSVT